MASAFIDALEAGDLEGVRRAPKADLHIHGFGGGDRDFIRERTGVDDVPVQGRLNSMAEMHAFGDANLMSAFSDLKVERWRPRQPLSALARTA